jgi:branched-chain amino acid transport system permease protein
VLGGLNSLSGAVVGGLLVGIVESMAGGYIHSNMMEVAPFVLIMLVLIVCPTGILSLYKARDV